MAQEDLRLEFSVLRLARDDAAERPFGALIHMDYIDMGTGSEASRAALYCLNIHDEKTDFFMPYPFHIRDAEAVLDAVHRFDELQGPPGPWHTTAAFPTGPKPMGVRSARTGLRSKGPVAH